MSQSIHEVIIRLVDQASAGIKAVNTSIQGFSGKLEKNREAIAAIWVASAAAFATLTMWVNSAIKDFSDFEAQMSGVKAVLNPTNEEFTRAKDLALELGKNTRYSAMEAAEMQEMLAKNGLNTKQILDGAAEASLNLAAATGAQLPQAADIASSSMIVFKKSLADLPQVVNSITGTANVSKFSIDDYALALAQWGGAAAAFGVSLEDFNAAIAAISPSFQSGSDAGTSFKVFLQRLVPASTSAVNAMEDLGIISMDTTTAIKLLWENGIKPASNSIADMAPALEDLRKKLWLSKKAWTGYQLEMWILQNQFFETNGKMKSMAEISEVLKQATKDLSDEQKISALSTIFGTDAMRAAAGMADVWSQKFNELTKAIEWTNAAENAKIRMQNLKGSIEQMNGSIQTAKIYIGEALNPVLISFYGIVEKVADRVGEFAKNNPELTRGIIIVAEAVLGATVALSGIALVLPSVIKWFSLMGGIIGSVGKWLSFLVSWPIGWAILAWVALVTAYTTNFLWFRDLVNNVLGWIWDRIGEFVEIAKKLWSEHGSKIVASAKELWDTVKKIFTDSFAYIWGELSKFFAVVGQFWNNHWSTIMAVVGWLWEGVKTVFKVSLDLIFNLVDATLKTISWAIKIFRGVFTGDWGMVWEWAKQIVGAGLEFIWNTISSVLKRINEFIKNVFGIDIAGSIKSAWDAVSNWTSKAWNWLLWIVKPVVDTIAGWINSIKWQIDGVVQKYESAKKTVGDGVNYVTSGKAGTDFVNNFSIQWVWGAISGARADGWPVSAGRTYLVGERWQELFVPKTDGTIIPNHALGGSSVININLGGVTVHNEADENRLVAKIKDTLSRELRTARLWIA